MIDRVDCRDLGHLPRNIAPHPTKSNLTLEHCLRCGVWIERSRDTGRDVELWGSTHTARLATAPPDGLL